MNKSIKIKTRKKQWDKRVKLKIIKEWLPLGYKSHFNNETQRYEQETYTQFNMDEFWKVIGNKNIPVWFGKHVSYYEDLIHYSVYSNEEREVAIKLIKNIMEPIRSEIK